jgi:hypothetical protein
MISNVSETRSKLNIGNFQPFWYVLINTSFYGGPGSSVGIATDYGLDGLGIEPGRGEIFFTRPGRPWGPPSLLYSGYRVFTGGKAAGAWC